jgi:hypothetical protein
MTKYFVFRNQAKDQQKNEPGSREEMACEIVMAIDNDDLPKDFYIAHPLESKQATFETLKEMAVCSIEIDDEREKIWTHEVPELIEKIHNLEDQIGEAYSNLYGSARELEEAIDQTEHFQDIDYFGPKSVARTFDNIEGAGMDDFTEKLTEIFEVEFFARQFA